MQSNSQKAFLELVRAGLWEKKVQLLSYGEVDFDTVFQLAQEQSVVGLVAAGLKQVADVSVPQETVLQFIGMALQFEQWNKDMNTSVGDLFGRLESAGITAVLVKGQGIAQCYARPLWRSCGDVDLFLNDANYKKAKSFLTPLATSVAKEGVREKHLVMTIDSWIVELHGRLYGGLSSRIEKELDDVYHDTFCRGNVRMWEGDKVSVPLLSVENDAFYVFTHFLQHFYKGGVGLRQICDWCRLLWTCRDKLESQSLRSRIHRAGLTSEWKAFGAFAVKYLGMPTEAMPFYSADSGWMRKADKICSFILEVGNMGHNRDSSFFRKYPYVIRKACSLGRRISDLCHHARIFPLDSARFSFAIMVNGIKSALRGE